MTEYERNNPEKEIEQQVDRLTSKIRTAQAILAEANTTSELEEGIEKEPKLLNAGRK